MTKRLRTRDITEVAIVRLQEPAVVVARNKIIAVLVPVEYSEDAPFIIELINDAIDAVLNQSQDNLTSFSEN